MADAAGGGPTSRRGPWLALVVLAVVAVVGFVGAYMLTGGDEDDDASAAAPAAGSDAASEEDEAEAPDYDIDVVADPDPPVVEGTDFTVTVTEDGAPVTGAQVRIDLEMTQHAHEGVRGDGEATGDGVYVVPVEFVMRGTWAGRVRVDAPGEATATERLEYDVQ